MIDDSETIDISVLTETWALRGHPTLIRRRWAERGVDVDSDGSITAFCLDCDGEEAISLLVDLASMSEEPELNRRASLTVDRILECYPDEE